MYNSIMKANTPEYMKEYKKKNREKLNEYKREWARKHRNRDYDRSYSKQAYRDKLPQRYATNLVNRLIALGELERLPCEVCSSLDSHAHHDDYSLPYEVRWLCKPHHMKWHSVNGPGKNRDTVKKV